MNNREIFERAQERIIPFFACDSCKRHMKEGEFVALIGKTPSVGLSMSYGRADSILKQIGRIYCEQCYQKLP